MQSITQPQIHIAKPCHQNWAKMNAVEQGKFCKSCSQIVTDFTQMSTPDLIRYFENKKGQIGCGRYREDQLSDPAQAKSPFQLRFSYMLSLFLLPFLTFFVSQSSAEEKKGIHTYAPDKELGPGPTTSHYYGKLLPRSKKKRRIRHSTGFAATF